MYVSILKTGINRIASGKRMPGLYKDNRNPGQPPHSLVRAFAGHLNSWIIVNVQTCARGFVLDLRPSHMMMMMMMMMMMVMMMIIWCCTSLSILFKTYLDDKGVIKQETNGPRFAHLSKTAA